MIPTRGLVWWKLLVKEYLMVLSWTSLYLRMLMRRKVVPLM